MLWPPPFVLVHACLVLKLLSYISAAKKKNPYHTGGADLTWKSVNVIICLWSRRETLHRKEALLQNLVH